MDVLPSRFVSNPLYKSEIVQFTITLMIVYPTPLNFQENFLKIKKIELSINCCRTPVNTQYNLL